MSVNARTGVIKELPRGPERKSVEGSASSAASSKGYPWSQTEFNVSRYQSRARTGRFIPRRLWCDISADWRFSQWLKNREYNAVGATALGLVLLKAWAVL